jgi:Carboxypeptidase regulatory-like domain
MLGVARPLAGASIAGTIEGVARDDRGQPLRRVAVTLRALGGNVNRQATSRADGRYRFAATPAGDYTITGAKEGLATAVVLVVSSRESGAQPISS